MPSSIRLCLALAGLLLLPAVAAAQATVVVRVTTTGGAPLSAVGVVLRSAADSSGVRSGETDGAGRVAWPGVPPGRYRAEAQRLGYATVVREIVVGGAGTLTVELALREVALGLPGVLVEAERRRARFEDNVGASSAELTQRDLKMLPALGEADVLRAVEVLPGVVSTSDFSSAFNVRGGAADQNLILLDGLPIYNPFHLGGLFSVFNADMIARAELLAGGFPAEYGGRVSSVLQIDSDAGGVGTDVQAGISLIATRLAVGTDLPGAVMRPLGLRNARVRVSGRRSYFDQLLRPLFEFPYHLTDLQAFAEAWTEGDGRVTVTAYTGRDVLNLTGVEDFPLRLRWQWGNDVAGASWVRPVGTGNTLDVRLGHSRFTTGLRFPEFNDTEFRSRIDQSLLRAQLSSALAAGTLTFGAGADRLDYDNLAESGGTVFGSGDGTAWHLTGFAQARLERGAWQAELGARIDGWIPRYGEPLTVPAPRLAVRRFIAGRDVAVKLAVGRYSQFAQSIRDEELPVGIDIWVLASERASHVISDQIQGGMEGYLHADWFTSLEGYLRTFEGVASLNPVDDPNDRLDDLLRGRGRSYGADLFVRRESGGIRPMLAVSWLRAWREFPDVLSGEESPSQLRYAPIFDRRLDVDLVVQAMLPRSLELGVRFNYGSGLPYTRPAGAYIYYDYSLSTGLRRPGSITSDDQPAVVLGPRNAERYPAYTRLDAGVRRTWRRQWGTLTPYVDVLNLLNRRNVLFYFYQYDRSPPTRAGISMFPVLPTAGVEIRF